MRGTAVTVAFLVVASLFIVAASLLPNADATTRYVGGGDPGNYTTIQAAINNANPGDTVFVYAGIYPESLLVDRPVSLIGEHKDTTTIDGGQAGDVIRVTADWVNISGFSVTNSGIIGSAAIAIRQVGNCTVMDNRVFSLNSKGIYLYYSEYSTVAYNEVLDNSYGVYAYQSPNSTIVGNTIPDNSDDGLRLSYSEDSEVADNIIYSNGDDGINVDFSENVTVTTNTVSQNGDDGIIYHHSPRGRILGNSISSNGYWGIYMRSSSDSFVVNNTLLSNTEENIYIDYTHRTELIGNIISGGLEGIYLHESDGDTIADNTVTGNSAHGIRVSAGRLTTIRNNTVSGNMNGISLYSSHWTDMAGNIVTDNQDGISLHSSRRNTIGNNTIHGNLAGINIWDVSDSNTVLNNTISWNSLRGMYISSSDETTVIDNHIIFNEGDGLLIGFSQDSNVSGNTFYSNGGYGVELFSSFNNSIFHNSFIANRNQAYDSSPNLWDDGYPSGGNYWDDYFGPDEKSGADQDQPGSDGIGDVPYIVEGGSNADRYPFTDSSAPVPAPLPDLPPSAPRGLLAVPGNQTVTLEWNPPVSDGGSAVTNYILYRGLAEGQESFLLETGNVLTYVDTDVVNGQTYYFKVSAKNAFGEGLKSEGADATPAAPPPNQSPHCQITDPEPGTEVSGTYMIEGLAYDFDGAIESVEVRIDNGPWILANGASTWSFTWNTTEVSDGNHTIYARSYDGTVYSDTVSASVTVQNEVSPPPSNGDGRAPEEIWVWILLAVLMISIILVLTALLLRRRRAADVEEEPGEPPPLEDEENSE